MIIMSVLPQSFYNNNTLKIAQALLGCFLVRKFSDGKTRRFKIVETEAYHGPLDRASHASRGRTPRNAVMFGEAGIIYVYFTYGMYNMLNVVTGPENYPAAILIRAVEPYVKCQRLNVKCRFDGPGRLTKALKIDRAFNGLPIFKKKHGLWIESRKEELKPARIARAARVGVDYAGAYKDKLWRFYIKDSGFVSRH